MIYFLNTESGFGSAAPNISYINLHRLVPYFYQQISHNRITDKNYCIYWAEDHLGRILD